MSYRISHLLLDQHCLVALDVHAARRVSARDRKGLESLCRCLHIRPPLAQQRLELREDGKVVLHLKRPFSDGTRAFLLEPLDFLSKLTALIPPARPKPLRRDEGPPPRLHRVRFHGVWAPRAKLRERVIPRLPESLIDGTRERSHARGVVEARHRATRALEGGT